MFILELMLIMLVSSCLVFIIQILFLFIKFKGLSRASPLKLLIIIIKGHILSISSNKFKSILDSSINILNQRIMADELKCLDLNIRINKTSMSNLDIIIRHVELNNELFLKISALLYFILSDREKDFNFNNIINNRSIKSDKYLVKVYLHNTKDQSNSTLGVFLIRPENVNAEEIYHILSLKYTKMGISNFYNLENTILYITIKDE
jgi:hypothetical protein